MLAAVAWLGSWADVCRADPWLEPGDLTMRHDLQLLSDAGIVKSPITTWPISWPDILRDVSDEAIQQSPALDDALGRVRRAARAASQQGFHGIGIEVAASDDPSVIRDFSGQPRGESEVAANAAWLGDRVAARVAIRSVDDLEGDRGLRLDGSYLGITFGNYMLSVGALEQWWGPGWDSSLILSTNARPVPRITLERKYSEASAWPVFRWFGPWRAVFSMGKADGKGEAVDGVRLFAARVSFRPAAWLEVGLSRTAQWCGDSRPCDLSTFGDLLIGRDNPGDSQTSAAEPGNQMAGYDFRLRAPWTRLPVAIYGQFIGEDEAGGMPAKFVDQFGLETWGGDGIGSWRARFEYSDTACAPPTNDPLVGCQTYRSNAYPQGYVYRGRILGSSLDNDSRSWTVATMLVRPSGSTYSLTARRLELNRDGQPDPQHATSPLGATDIDQYELQWTAPRFGGTVTLGVGYDAVTSGSPVSGSGVRGFLRYTRGL